MPRCAVDQRGTADIPRNSATLVTLNMPAIRVHLGCDEHSPLPFLTQSTFFPQSRSGRIRRGHRFRRNIHSGAALFGESRFRHPAVQCIFGSAPLHWLALKSLEVAKVTAGPRHTALVSGVAIC